MSRSRDEEFGEFVAARYASLVRTAFLLVGDRGHAEDAVQTALLKTYSSWGRLQEPGNAEAYARTTMVRDIGRWRRRRWRGEVPTAELPDVPTSDERVGVDVLRALAELSPAHRAVLVLRFFDDLSEAQTAHVLGISQGTVKSRTSRALAALRTSEVLDG